MVEKAGRGLKEGKAIPLTDAYSSEAEGKRGCELLLHFHFHSDPPTSSSLFRLPAVLCCGGVMAAAAAATTYLTWNSKLPVKSLHRSPPFSCSPPRPHRSSAFSARAFRRSDLDNFAKRVASGEAWRDAWRSANNGFELFIFEARKTAERIDRRYSVSRRLTAVAESAADRARDLDREFEIRQRWRSFTIDFSRNWPRVRSFSFVRFHLCYLPFNIEIRFDSFYFTL